MTPEEFASLQTRLVGRVYWYALHERSTRYIPKDEFRNHVVGAIPAEPYDPAAFKDKRGAFDAMEFAMGLCTQEYNMTISRMQRRVARITEPLRDSAISVQTAIDRCVLNDEFCWLMNQMAAYYIATCILLTQIESIGLLHEGVPEEGLVDIRPSYVRIAAAREVASEISGPILP